MFVQDFKVIDAPYGDVEARLDASSEAFFAEALGSSQVAGERITAKVGPKGWPAALSKTVAIRLGPVRRHGDSTLIAFSWQARGGASLFPRLDADLEVAPFGLDQTVLTIRGAYEAPAGWPGRVADELLLHRIAESTLRAFLDSLCAQLSHSLSIR